MGRKAKATRENVTAAIKHLLVKDGSEASISANSIRKIVGGGSLSTITNLLNSLRSDHPEIFIVPEKTDMGEFNNVFDYITDLKLRLDVISNHLRTTTENQPQPISATLSDSEQKSLEHRIFQLEKMIHEKDMKINELQEKIKTLESSTDVSSVSQSQGNEIITTPSSTPSSIEDEETVASSEHLFQAAQEKPDAAISDNNDDSKQIENVPASKQKSLKPKAKKDDGNGTQLSLL